jgi:hypothetical protein
MFNQIFKGVKMGARLVRQSFFQPSRAFDFLGDSEKNRYIYLCSFVFTGLIAGILLAIILPLNNNSNILTQRLLLALAASAPFATAAPVAFTRAVTSKIEFAFESALTFTGAVVFVFVGAIALAFAGNSNGVFAFGGALAGAVAMAAAVSAQRASAYLYSFTFMGITMVILSILGGRIEKIEIYETIIYPLTFLIGYLLVSSFEFQKNNINFKADFKNNLFRDIDNPRLRFVKAQILSWVWGLLFALLICIPIYFQWGTDLHSKLLINAFCFAVLPIFILRIPDYLIVLPIWFYQRRKILSSPQDGKAMMAVYNNSLLFKHELIYFQLPGIHKIMAVFAKNKEIGLQETVKQIGHLYWFTFQQKQARKSIIAPGKDNNTAHQCIHILLEDKNPALVKCLSQENRLAELYLMLFEEKDNKSHKPVKTHFPLFRIFRGLKPSQKEKNHPIEPALLIDRIHLVGMEMKKEKKYRFNNEMVHTIETAHQLLTANILKDLYKGCERLETVREYPVEINYFSHLQLVYPSLEKIKNRLVTIEKIEHFESKRSFIMEQKEALNNLLKSIGEKFYQPFQTIWQKVLQHCIELLEKEIKLLQGSAVLDIQLKNQNIFSSNEEQSLYFKILNKGQEMASGISITLQAVSPRITLGRETVKEIQVIEAGKEKEVALTIKAQSNIETTIKGTLTFSDRTGENKSISFSFPITVLKRRKEFKKIDNPYVVGQPLTGDTPLFFGREDAYRFIDENITASGGERHIIVCHGLRRAGKTSLLYHINTHGLSDERLLPIYIDMQGINYEKDFYYSLSSAIKEKLSLPSSTGIDSFGYFKQFLREIKPHLGQRILLLMIDEFEELQMRVEKKMIEDYIFSNIRHLMQHEQKLAFLFCGSHKLEEMSADYWSIFFNTAIYYRISHLSPEDARRLIIEPVQGKLTYEDLAVEQILKMTNGQPHLTQLICRTIVNELNETKKRNDALVNDVDNAVEKVISIGTESFSQHIWSKASLLEKLILSASAEELTNKQLDRIGVDDIFDRIHSLTDRFDRKEAIRSLGKLVSQEILCEAENGYYFPVNLLRKWIAFRFPLRKLREEI